LEVVRMSGHDAVTEAATAASVLGSLERKTPVGIALGVILLIIEYKGNRITHIESGAFELLQTLYGGGEEAEDAITSMLEVPDEKSDMVAKLVAEAKAVANDENPIQPVVRGVEWCAGCIDWRKHRGPAITADRWDELVEQAIAKAQRIETHCGL
jgi:hypothetical protein